MPAAFRLVFIVLAASFLVTGATESATRELTLRQAVALALEGSPRLRALRAETDSAEAELTTASTYPFNPIVDLEIGSRDRSAGSSTDARVAISQEIEIRGQRGKRVDSARGELEASRLRYERERKLLVGRVVLEFVGSVKSRELLEVRRADRALAGDLAGLTDRRLRAGAIAALEANLARVSLARAEGSEEGARAVYRVAQASLAGAVGLEEDELAVPVGELTLPEARSLPLSDLLPAAMERREDLLAGLKLVEAAETRLELARAEAFGTVALGGFYKKEEGSDTIVGGAVRFGLPFFDRNQGEIEAARAELLRARAEAEARTLTVREQVVSAHARLQAAAASVRSLEEGVLGTLEDNLNLLRRAYESGKIASGELLLFRRELTEARRQYVEAVAEAWRAAVVLDLATGRTPMAEATEVD